MLPIDNGVVGGSAQVPGEFGINPLRNETVVDHAFAEQYLKPNATEQILSSVARMVSVDP